MKENAEDIRRFRPESRAKTGESVLTRAPKRSAFKAGHTAGIVNRGAYHAELSAPTQMIFLISLALAILAVLGALVSIPFVSLYAFWIAIIGYIVLAAGCVMKGV